MARRVKDLCIVVPSEFGTYQQAVREFSKRVKRSGIFTDLHLKNMLRTSREKKRYKRKRERDRIERYRRQQAKR